MRGKVKFYHRIKGWGFILGDDGEEFFCHHTGISGTDLYKYLNDGEVVEFDIKPATKGKLRLAVNITTDTQANEVQSAEKTS